MMVVGLWHGASNNFVIWGLLHGVLISSNHLINRINLKSTHREIKKIQTILVFGNKEFNTDVLKLSKNIGAYRVIDANYIFKRHPLEALDGIHLVNEFTYQISVVGSISYN